MLTYDELEIFFITLGPGIQFVRHRQNKKLKFDLKYQSIPSLAILFAE